MRDDVDDDKAELRRVQNREQVKRTQMIVKGNVSVQMALTVRIACSGVWAGSLMIMGPMHEEMSFKIDTLRRSRIDTPEVPGGARDPED